jgi:nitrite reductase/ring-hydroxylating ferredoxin subunit
MLSKEDNELLTRVGPGTPMGELMREYWVPALPAAEFPEPDSPPKRMRLLGENLVMFRDSKGDVGCFVEACPHRGASLFFGRNEEEGLRCVYHGWKFDVTGACVDMPSEPAESNFKNKVRVRAYPTRDVNHMVWVYMGSRETPPPFPAFEINTLPIENVNPPGIMMEEANWVQNLEGDLDSNHLDYLHSRVDAMRYRLFNEAPPTETFGFFPVYHDKMPRLDIVPTPYGAFYSARRTWQGDGSQEWHRINQFIFPFHTMITGGNRVNLRSFVPLDDEWSMLISHSGSLTPIPDEERYSPQVLDPFGRAGGYMERTSDPRTYFNTKANRSNDFMRDYDMERTTLVCGVPLVGNLQDRAMTELMTDENGTHIYDRSHEHLGTLDTMVITVRRQLLKAAKMLRDQGVAPPNVDNVQLDRVRHATVVLPTGDHWVKTTEKARQADGGLPIAHELKPFAETPLALKVEAT